MRRNLYTNEEIVLCTYIARYGSGRFTESKVANYGGRSVDSVIGVPGLDTEALDQAIDKDGLDPRHRGGIVAEVGRDRRDHALEAFLPPVGAEVGQVGALACTIEERFGYGAHRPSRFTVDVGVYDAGARARRTLASGQIAS